MPFEILGLSGKDKTKCLNNNDEISPVKWWFCKGRVAKPSCKCFRKWRKFVKWLQHQRLGSKLNHEMIRICKWKMTEDRKIMRCEDEQSQVQWHKKAEHGKKMHKRSDKPCEQGAHVKGVLATYLKKGKILEHDVIERKFQIVQ